MRRRRRERNWRIAAIILGALFGFMLTPWDSFLQRKGTVNTGGKMRKEFGPSQSQQMIRGLVEAARQLQEEERSTLKLSKEDEQFLQDAGVRTKEGRTR
jgi:uncharacterized protein YjiS (DUF1127 family)